MKRWDLSFKADLTTCRDIIDQINGIWATTIEEDVEISIIHHSTDIEQLLRNRMLYLSQLAYYVKICMSFQEILHCLVHLCLWVILCIFLQVLGGNTSDHILNISVWW